MDGYSVSEAASVLGVPIERVWELLARGVLAGAPEGETGMRVFLQPRPAPAPAPPIAAAPPENGGSREPERELSPFRELLTEFRNLTERYGQALLALGESRGEVAALRSRVDLLEARMDLGLPPPGRVAGGWGGSSAFPTETVVPAPSAADAGEHDEHRARPRGPRRATESFAEALARADDPTAPELPAVEADEPGRAAHDEPALPRELPAAETVPVADEDDAPGPDVADAAAVDEGAVVGDAAVSDVAVEADAAGRPEAPDEGQAVGDIAEPAPAAADGDAAGPAMEPEPTAIAEPEPAEEELAPDPEATDDVVEDAQPVAWAQDASEVEEPGVAEAPAEPTWDTERYTAAIDEPDWYEAEADDDVPAAGTDSEAGEQAVQAAAPDGPAEEETVLWLGQQAAPATLPGGDELESALEALAAAEPAPAPEAAAEAEPEPEPERDTPAPASPRVDALEQPSAATPQPMRAAERPAPAVPPSALRYRPVTPTGPTGRAYRRLRRIFPN